MFVEQFYGNILDWCQWAAVIRLWLQWSVQLRMSATVDINNININIGLVTATLPSVSFNNGFNKGKSSIIFWEVEDIMPSWWSLIHHYKPNFDNHIHELNHQYLWKNTRYLLVKTMLEPDTNIGTFHFVSHNNQSVNAIKKHILSLTSIK